DPLVVVHTNTAPNLSYRYVITDNSPDSIILAIAGTNEISLDGAGPGTCQIWGWSYRGLADNGASFIGSPLADLNAVDCSDISDNSIEVIREEADGGEVRVDLDATGNPNNTTSISANGESVVICVDGRPDPLVVVHDNTAPNLTYRYVITDLSDTILAIADTNTIDLDGAGTGACKIWGWSYRGLDQSTFIGGPLSDLAAEDCSDISDNSILVVRQAADGGNVEIDIAATGNPNNTTSISADGMTAVICVDGRPDPIVVSHITSAAFLSYRYVITNEDASEILAITDSDTINLDGAGPGTCQIWGWSYRGLADNGASFIGGPLSDLQAVDCSDLSDESITVIREAADGGTVTLANGDTEVTICAGDGQPDPLEVVHTNTAPNLTFQYVVTDSDANNTILAIFNTNIIDLEGAGEGVCRIWGWSYRGLDGASFIGEPLQMLQDEDCSDISDDFIEVIRLTGADCEVLGVEDAISSDDFSIYPNPANSIVNISYAGNPSLSIAVTMYDITGRKVRQITLADQSSNTIDVSGLPGGIYLLNLLDVDSGNAVNKRLIVR
ncbi:MAG: T9SS type A sorting domain-containing protein, partial [Bacteroidota bacterium]